MTKNETLNIPKLNFDSTGELIIEPTSSSSKHDFNFFEGKWKLHNKKLKSRLSNCTEWIEFDSTQEMYRVLNGIGNIDNFLATINEQPFEGMSREKASRRRPESPACVQRPAQRSKCRHALFRWNEVGQERAARGAI